MNPLEAFLLTELGRQGQQGPQDAIAKLSLREEAEYLSNASVHMDRVHVFERRQIIRQKKACQFYRVYGHNGIAIVVEILDDPIVIPQTWESIPTGSAPMRHDMIVGQNDPENGLFVLFYVDSRRWEPVPDSEIVDLG
jgi:hypothetical protein